MKLSFLFNFVYIFHQRVLCLCLFLTNTCPVTVCPVTPVLIRQKLFPLLDDSAPLKPFGLLISSLSVENRLREKFPAGCICIFAHLAISRQINRATQQFQHLCGVELQHTVSISGLYCGDGGANKIPFLMNRENQGLLSLPLIHLAENIPPLNSFPFRAIFLQWKLLLNSSFFDHTCLLAFLHIHQPLCSP